MAKLLAFTFFLISCVVSLTGARAAKPYSPCVEALRPIGMDQTICGSAAPVPGQPTRPRPSLQIRLPDEFWAMAQARGNANTPFTRDGQRVSADEISEGDVLLSTRQVAVRGSPAGSVAVLFTLDKDATVRVVEKRSSAVAAGGQQVWLRLANSSAPVGSGSGGRFESDAAARSRLESEDRRRADAAATAAKVLACYKAGSDTVIGMYACSGFWVTPRVLTLCFLQAGCPVIEDSTDALSVVAATLGGADKLESKLSIDLADALEIPSRDAIDACQANPDPATFEDCVSRKATPASLAPILGCASSPTDRDWAVCLAGTGAQGASDAMKAVGCIAGKGGDTSALRDCAVVQPWDDVQAVRTCVASSTSDEGRVDCLLTRLDAKERDLGRCLSAADGRPADALSCFGERDSDVARRIRDVRCAMGAGTDGGRLAACFAEGANGDGGKVAACALGEPMEITSCLVAARPEYRAAAQIVACADGGRDAGSLVANCSDTLIRDPKTRATLACAAGAGSDARQLAGCAASAVFPPEIARFATCAASSQGPTSFALCAARPLMNEEWRIAAECAVQTGGDPVGFAGCTAGRLTLKELAQCLDGKGCFGPNNTIVKAYANAFDDVLHGPGKNNDLVVALTRLDELSGGQNSVINRPEQVFGGDHSIFHEPGQMLGGANSVANDLVKKPFGGGHSLPNDVAHGMGHAVNQVTRLLGR